MKADGGQCKLMARIDGYCIAHYRIAYGVTDDRTMEQRERY